MFDEIALMNDINAACAGAAQQPQYQQQQYQQQQQPPPPTVSVEDRLAKLDQLKSKNLVSEQEYAARRQKILDEL